MVVVLLALLQKYLRWTELRPLKKLDCVDSLIREVTMLRNEIALKRKPEFPFLKAAKSGPSRNRNDRSSSHHSATVNKKRKADDLEFETVQRKV